MFLFVWLRNILKSRKREDLSQEEELWGFRYDGQT